MADAKISALTELTGTPANDDLFVMVDTSGTVTKKFQFTSLSALFAPTAKGVTNGDTHDHVGGDGAQIDHTGLSNIGTNTHAQIDTAITASTNHIANTSNPHTVTASQVGNTTAQWNANKFYGSDVDSTVGSPTDGKILVWRSAGGDWVLEDKPASGSTPALNDITDVTITGPVADKEFLTYDTGTSKWINRTANEAGLLTNDTMADASRTTDQTISTATFTKVQLSNEVFDPSGDYDPTTNYRYTAPTTGKYLVTASLQYTQSTAPGRFILLMYKNGSSIIQGEDYVETGNTRYPSHSISRVLELTATDYIEMYTYQTSGADQDVNGQNATTFMSIALMSQ